MVGEYNQQKKARRLPAKILRAAYTLSLRDAATLLFSRFRSPSTPPEITEAFLGSDEYVELMSRHLPYDGSYDLHEAQNETANFRFRHFEARGRLGVFRWRGIQKHLARIRDLVIDSELRVIDFGGAACPLGFNSMIVDHLDTDVRGNAVPYNTLAAVPPGVDVVFSSHCLEHISQLDDILQEMVGVLREEGILILHLPAFTCERWRAGIHRNRKYNDHVWTFGLGETEIPEGLANYVQIDGIVGKHCTIDLAEYCGDDSIFLRCRK